MRQAPPTRRLHVQVLAATNCYASCQPDSGIGTVTTYFLRFIVESGRRQLPTLPSEHSSLRNIVDKVLTVVNVLMPVLH